MPAYRTTHRPLGHATRGKTAPNRLRRLDAMLCALEPGLIRRRDRSVFLDLGFGRLPLTTLESARQLQALNPSLEVVGVELDRARVEAAQAFSQPGVRFLRGGFEVDPGAPIRILRAMNVLRQYDEPAVADAWAEMGARVIEGGLVIEGTSDPLGRLIAVNLLRKEGGALRWRGILFSTNLRGGDDPRLFQPILPKSQIHRVVPGEPIHRLFSAWNDAWLGCQPLRPFGARAVFREAARRLATREPLERRSWLDRRGYVWWRPDPATALRR